MEEEKIAILATREASALLKNPQEYTVVGNCTGCSNDINLFKEFITWYNSENSNTYNEKFFPVIRTLKYYFKDNLCTSNNFYGPKNREDVKNNNNSVTPTLQCYGIFYFFTNYQFKYTGNNGSDIDEVMQREIAENVFNKVDETTDITFTTCVNRNDLKIGIFNKNNEPVLLLDLNRKIKNPASHTIYMQTWDRDWWGARSILQGISVFGSAIEPAVNQIIDTKRGTKRGIGDIGAINNNDTKKGNNNIGGKPLTKRHRKKRQNKKRKSRKSKK